MYDQNVLPHVWRIISFVFYFINLIATETKKET